MSVEALDLMFSASFASDAKRYRLIGPNSENGWYWTVCSLQRTAVPVTVSTEPNA